MADTMQIAFLCQRLKELRTANGLTMDGMAERLGVRTMLHLTVWRCDSYAVTMICCNIFYIGCYIGQNY